MKSKMRFFPGVLPLIEEAGELSMSSRAGLK